MKFRKKPVVINASRFKGGSESLVNIINELSVHDDVFRLVNNGKNVIVHTLEGNMVAEVGDWIIKGVIGEVYPVKPDIFEATYEPAE